MISSVAIDDEPRAISIIKEYVKKVDFLELNATFRDPTEAISFLNENEIQLLFLDINMPDITGLQLPTLLKHSPLVIFTTAYPQHALESYDLDVVDYLLKPIEFSRFLKSANRVKSRLYPDVVNSTIEDFLTIKSGPKVYRIRKADILYLEKEGHYMIYHTKERKILSRASVKESLQRLSSNDFIQVHRSFIVALKHVSVLENAQVHIGDRKIPIGASFREQFMQAMNAQP